jgi:hypothetical protein
VNENFVAVKVDRDQNPEIDRFYQQQVGALIGGGGWPLTAFLFPDGETFFGGTYYPVRDSGGMPGFRRVLKEVVRMWREDPAALRESNQNLRNALLQLVRREKGADVTAIKFRESVTRTLNADFDPENGGWGTAPKFPHPLAVSFLLFQAWREQDRIALDHARLTLDRMANGGVYDQLGGGFHRYSVDRGWHIPHFEKMSVDNSHLLRCYVEAASALRGGPFSDTVAGLTDFVLGTLARNPEGGFAASQDADNAPGDDGSYYTWSRTELKGILGPDELKVVRWRYGLDTEGVMPLNAEQNVLFNLFSPDEVARRIDMPESQVEMLLSTAREKMVKARTSRAEPFVDPALYASLNGGMIGAVALAGRFLGDVRAIETARRAADRFLEHAYSPTRGMAHLLSGWGGVGWGLLDDQAEFAIGLLDLAEVTGEGSYLDVAKNLLDICLKEFTVPEEEGILRDIAPAIYDGTKLGPFATSSFPLDDSPHLSANAAVIMALDRLFALTGDARYDEKAGKLLETVLPRMRRAGLFAAGAALASGIHEIPVVRVVIEGEGSEAEALYAAAARAYHPRRVVFCGEPRPPFTLPEEAVAEAAKATVSARALVCRGTSCFPPVTDTAALSALIERTRHSRG